MYAGIIIILVRNVLQKLLTGIHAGLWNIQILHDIILSYNPVMFTSRPANLYTFHLRASSQFDRMYDLSPINTPKEHTWSGKKKKRAANESWMIRASGLNSSVWVGDFWRLRPLLLTSHPLDSHSHLLRTWLNVLNWSALQDIYQCMSSIYETLVTYVYF